MGLDRPEEDEHHHDHDHDHDHIMLWSRQTLNWQGTTSKAQLETLLPALIADHGLLRSRAGPGYLGKSHPLQIQAVGPRLEFWFDSDSCLIVPAAMGWNSWRWAVP